METIGAYEAKTHLPRLLKRVAQGETFTITKHGMPIARLVPIDERAKPNVRQVIEEIREFRKGHRLNGLSIKEMINEGRRF